ncbi:MAG: FtsH protease activity modulator HflK [Alphaproteobacteria bacterium]|nr:FtsH protease activity modulator HflK [Alphaproteobacteria bacterium]
MPWENKGGGGRGPWGQGPSGGNRGGSQPPDLEELLRRSQDRLRRAIPSGPIGPGVFIVGAILVAGAWLASGFYQVGPGEVGVETRFGRLSELTNSGLQYHLPWPFEAAETVDVQNVVTMPIGYDLATSGTRPSGQRSGGEDSLMLTQDENILDIDFSVVYRVKDAADYLFNVEKPENSIRAVAESAMREVIGRNKLVDVLGRESVGGAGGGKRDAIQLEVAQMLQTALDSYRAGIEIQRVQFQRVDPPQDVIDAFREVQAARTEGERLQNEAVAYANKVVPEARGEAERIKQQAEAFRIQAIAEARGETQRLLQLYGEYRRAPDITRERIFIETMERVLSGMNKVIIDEKQGGAGVMPYLPLQELRRPTSPQAATPAPAPGGN